MGKYRELTKSIWENKQQIYPTIANIRETSILSLDQKNTQTQKENEEKEGK